MAVYNVLMAVVELVEARDEAEACEILAERLTAAGFDPMEGAEYSGAFESEDLDEQTLAVVTRREAIAPIPSRPPLPPRIWY